MKNIYNKIYEKTVFLVLNIRPENVTNLFFSENVVQKIIAKMCGVVRAEKRLTSNVFRIW